LSSCARSCMATIRLPNDFKEFLQLLNNRGVEYLVVGGYAVGFYGYPRATGDIDVWIAPHSENVQRLMRALRQFGFPIAEQPPEAFLNGGQFLRLGVPPLRIEILTE